MERMCFGHFQAAAAAAATFELRVRLYAELAEGTPVAKASLSTDLTKLIGMVAAHFGATDDETKQLTDCAKIRNKLFHLELSRVTGRVVALREQLAQSNVWTMNLETGDAHPVEGTSTATDGIYGWMLESTASGAFAAVAKVMADGEAILTRLRDAWQDRALS